jgi:hypothetical protein
MKQKGKGHEKLPAGTQAERNVQSNRAACQANSYGLYIVTGLTGLDV